MAFAATERGGSYGSGNWDVWTLELDGAEPVPLTRAHSGFDRAPSWAPGGDRVAFWSSRQGGGYFMAPASGGTIRKLFDATQSAFGVGPLQWSRDAERVAFVAYEEGRALLELRSNRDGSSDRVPLEGHGRYRVNLSWSPRANLLAYIDADGFGSDLTRLWTVDLDTRKATPITGGETSVWSPSWSPDGKQLLFVSNRGGSLDLWRQSVDAAGRPVGGAERLTEGLELRSASVSPDGARVAYSRGRRITNIYRIPRSEGVATWADAEQLTFDGAWTEMIDVSPNGRQLVLSSDRRGQRDLWLMPSDGGIMQRLTSHHSPDRHPRWSDGRQIVFYSSRAGSRDLWLLPLAGLVPQRLTHDGVVQDYGSTWSPDGREIAYRSRRDAHNTLWKISIETGAVRPLTSEPAEHWMEDWSPDGRWIVFASDRSGTWQIYRMPADGGNAHAFTRGPGRSGRWAPDGEWFYFTGWDAREGDLWAVSADGIVERRVTRLGGRRGYLALWALAVSHDHIYFGWEEDQADIWVADLDWN